VSLENYGNYQLIKRLAMGGMAQIYLARRKGPEASDKLLVVKRILPHLAENVDFVRMFLDEAKIAARLAHPNIVEIFDLGAQDDSFFLAMEYIHGEDLRRLCKRADQQGRHLTVPLACRIVIDACSGLDYAHKKEHPPGTPLDIVHRDISPQNILVSFEGVVKVVDFGIAKAADQATVTRSGVLKGKYSYMSPEQAAGKRVDRRSDVFALGVVLYELLTNTRLFKRPNDMQTLSAVAECKVDPPSKVSPRVPADLDPIVMKALAREPEDRYSEALQLQVALEEWLAAQQISVTSADLSAFMREVYAERLAREARAGTVVVEDEPPSTGLRAAVDGQRRSGMVPSISSKDVTRADRGDPAAAAAAAAAAATSEAPEGTERSPPRPNRASRNLDLRREPDGERLRAERRTSSHRVSDVRRAEPAPPPRAETNPETELLSQTDVNRALEAASQTDMTMVPRASVRTRRLTAIVAASVSAVLVAVLLWIFLRPGPPPTMVSLRLETTPAGAKVIFDGQVVQGLTPLELPPRVPGTYRLLLTREGYGELRDNVVVHATEAAVHEPLRYTLTRREPAPPDPSPVVTAPTPPAPTPPTPPVPESFEITLEAEPAQAIIVVDGVERGPSPQTVLVKPEQELDVRVSAPQHRSFSRKVKVGKDKGQLERFVLEPLPKPTPVVSPSIKQTRVDPPPKPPVTAAKAPVRFVVVPTTSWVEVVCNGKNYGTTPFDGDISLAVGTYQCKFTNSDEGRTLNRTIEVKASGLNKVIVNLRDGTVKF
jgi:serine/threonine protein kinase